MRILQINAVHSSFSTGRTCMEKQRELERRGHICYTAYALRPGNYQHAFYIKGKADRKIHAIMSRVTGLEGYYSHWATRRLIRFIEQQRIEVVHIHNLHSHYVNLKMLFHYLREKNIATVITLHDCWMYTGKCTHYTTQQCGRWKEGCGKCPQLRAGIPSYFFDQTKRMLRDKAALVTGLRRAAVVGVSDWITREAENSRLNDGRVIFRRIYNWIDSEVFRPVQSPVRQKYGLENKFVIIGVSTNWTRNKGLLKMIELAGSLREDEVILLVGQVEQAVKLPAGIIHFPFTYDTALLAQYYSASDCFISFSKEESFGKTVAEAVACGVPAIVYNSTALPEIVGENCGIVVEDTADIRNALDQIKRLGKAHFSPYCISFAKNNFDLEKNVGEYEELYKALLEKK